MTEAGIITAHVTDKAAVRDHFIEVMAQKLAFHRLGKTRWPVRWPEHSEDRFADDSGVAPVSWDYAENCRAEVRAMVAGLELELTIPPFPAKNGMVYKPFRVEYEVPISSASAEALRLHDAKAGFLLMKLRAEPHGWIHTDLCISEDNGWAIFITLNARDDTAANRDRIAETIKEHIDICVGHMEGATA